MNNWREDFEALMNDARKMGLDLTITIYWDMTGHIKAKGITRTASFTSLDDLNKTLIQYIDTVSGHRNLLKRFSGHK